MTDLQVPALTPELWKELNSQGKSNAEIARITNRSPQAVSSMLSYYGIEKPQTRAQRLWPWAVEGTGYQQAAACKHLRRHVTWMTDGRKGMSAVRRTRLLNFYKMLQQDQVVVEFNPDFPPVKGVSTEGGWAYQKRKGTDPDDLIIRINPLVVPDIDDEFLEFWSIPDRAEWPKAVGRYD